MKIEKINDNQIRCTLNRQDLASRHLKLSELAYGSDKAKELFKDMMQQASYEFGFEAEDIPLMIEAIPVSPDCIILIITKVSDPDELDSKLSRFNPSTTLDDEDIEEEDDDYEEDGDEYEEDYQPSQINSADEVINIFNKLSSYLKDNLSKALGQQNQNGDKPDFIPLKKELLAKATESEDHDASMEQALLDNLDNMETIEGTPEPDTEKTSSFEINFVKLYSFDDIETLAKAASIVDSMYDGESYLFKDDNDSRYYLWVSKSDCSAIIYNKVCNILSEYGYRENCNYARFAYFMEHCTPIIQNDAIAKLAGIC